MPLDSLCRSYFRSGVICVYFILSLKILPSFLPVSRYRKRCEFSNFSMLALIELHVAKFLNKSPFQPSIF